MDSITLGPWTIHYDADATRDAYAAIVASDAKVCSCAECRNFRLAQEQGKALPPELLALLQRFGVSCQYPAEIVSMYPEAGGWRYEGWFHFVGAIVANDLTMEPESVAGVSGLRYDGDALVWLGAGKNCGIWLTSTRTLLNKVFAELPTVQLDFEVDVPWLLAVPDSPVAKG